jgi:hypothetical protein
MLAGNGWQPGWFGVARRNDHQVPDIRPASSLVIIKIFHNN